MHLQTNTQTYKTPRVPYKHVWQYSNHHIQMFAKLAKHLQKHLMLRRACCMQIWILYCKTFLQLQFKNTHSHHIIEGINMTGGMLLSSIFMRPMLYGQPERSPVVL